MFLHPVYLTLLIVGCVAIGAVCGPAIHTAFAEAKVKVEAKYSTQITSITAELAAVKLQATNDVSAAKADFNAALSSMRTRAETAESDLAALKRFLPGAPAAQPAPVVAAPVPNPVIPQPVPIPQSPVQDNTGAAATGTTGAFTTA